MKKRILTVLLAMAMVFTYMPFAAFASKTPVSPAKEITFTYTAPVKGGEYQDVCYYSDSYFSHSATEFDLSLATMTMALAFTACGAESTNAAPYKTPAYYANQPKNVAQLMKDIGMAEEDIVCNEGFQTKPTMDSIGVIAGSKKVGDATLIAIAVRGSSYYAEWGSNFKVGKSGNHQGFKKAADDALAFVTKYIKDKKIKGKVKFWVTGYSRGAACANILASYLDNMKVKASGLKYTNRDVYAYTFESPRGAISTNLPKSLKYSNIFNIVNPNDPVSYLAPGTFGFSRYGVDKFLPTQETLGPEYASLEAKMVDRYYALDEFKTGEVLDYTITDDQAYFLERLAPKLMSGVFGNRSLYYKEYQNIVSKMVSEVNEMPGETAENFKIYLTNELMKKADVIKSLLGSKKSADQKLGLKEICQILNRAYRYVGANKAEVKTTSQEVLLLANVVKYISLNQDDFMRLINTFENIKVGHYPEVAFAWMCTMDKNYGGDGIARFTNGDYRIVKYPAKGKLTIYDGKGKAIDLDSFLRGTEANGQAYVVIPAKGKYKVALRGTFEIYKYNASSGKTSRIVRTSNAYYLL